MHYFTWKLKLLSNILWVIAENKSEIKDLGIIVHENLRFLDHIIDKVKKANQIMQIIRRSMVYLNRHSSNLLYTALVRLHPEYGNVVWSLFLKSNITLIESVQGRATRYAPDTNKLDYQEKLEALNLATLQSTEDFVPICLKRTKSLMYILKIIVINACLK